MKKTVRLILIGLVAVSLAAGAYLYFRPAQVNAVDTTNTATVSRNTLTASVSAAGNIESHQTADLAFGQSGTVKTLNVKVGDTVKAGEMLAELDTTDLELQLKSAEVNLKNAQASLAKTQKPNTEADIANAKAQLTSAQAAYDKLKAGPTTSELATAQAQVTSAKAAYDAAVQSAATSDSSLESAAAALEKASISLQQAQSAYDKISWRGDVGASSEAQALQTATIDYNTAKSAYEALAVTSRTDAASKVASAAAALKSAQANLASVKNSVSAAELAAAEATLTQAQINLDTLLAGSDANTLAIAQGNVDSAQIAVDQARLKQAQAQVVAPFDGTVTAINVKVGQTASGTAFTIADLNSLEVVVSMSEVDVNQVKTGQSAEVTLDAVPDLTLKGTVTAVSPSGTQSSGVVSYPVTVTLDKASDSVKTGMTANLTILTDQADNVLIVPSKAIKTINRQKMVIVLRNGQQVQMPVQTGLTANSMTEITSGLQEGDVVLVSGTSTTTTSSTVQAGGMGALGAMTGAGGPPPGGN
ncbi:MAG: efflux RND transporter periplasmic adaptor subunit [Nitrososphaerales archaeon]